MTLQLIEKIETAIELLRSIQQELSLKSVQVVVFPENRKELIDKRICLSCEEPILPGEKDVRKVHERCRKEQKASGRTDAELIALGLLAPEEISGRKKMNRLEKKIAIRMNAVAEGLPTYDISAGKPTPAEAAKIIEKVRKSKSKEPPE